MIDSQKNIRAKPFYTLSGHQELSVFIDGFSLDIFLYKKTGENALKDLWPAWLLLGNDPEGKYLWSLLDGKSECNIPILLCPDDIDFSCMAVVAQTRYEPEFVIWERIGIVDQSQFNVKEWRESGIQNINKWSDDDWSLYGETLAHLDTNDELWQTWWSEHWPDEASRRVWNYYHPFFNNNNNIKWLPCERFIFRNSDYDACIEKFRTHMIAEIKR